MKWESNDLLPVLEADRLWLRLATLESRDKPASRNLRSKVLSSLGVPGAVRGDKNADSAPSNMGELV